MKRIFSVLFIITLLAVSLISCGSSKDIDVDKVVNDIVKTYELTDGSVYTSASENSGEYLDEDLIIGYYGDITDWPDFSKVESYCTYIDESNYLSMTDVGIFKMKDTTYSDTFMQYLQGRVDAKISLGNAYPDIDVATLKKAVVRKKGDYVYYVVSPQVDKIISDIEGAFGK